MLDILPHLPLSAAELAAEGEALAVQAEKDLAGILLTGSTRSVRPAVAFLSLKHKVSAERVSRIARLLFSILKNAAGDVASETRTATVLADVLKVLNKVPDCPPPGDSARLQMEWRPIYDALMRVQLRGASWEQFAQQGGDLLVGSDASKRHAKAFVGLARRARAFFPPAAAREVLEQFRPILCPHEKSFYKAAALICLFLPDELSSAGGAAAVLEELSGVWALVTNQNDWQVLWMTLFSRFMRHNQSAALPAMEALVPKLLETFIRVIEVPTGAKSPQRPESLGWPDDCSFLLGSTRPKEDMVKKLTRVLIFSLAPDSNTMKLLRATLAYLKPFFHPLQEGEHTKPLDMFLKMITLNFAKRLGMEAGMLRAKRPWSPVHALSQDDRHEFSALVMPLALTAFYSKNQSMTFSASQALKDLSTICPELVVAELFQRIEPAIQNIMKPSEVQNAISLASYVLPMLLRSEGGADTLSSVLGMTVAGIDTNDPMKTMYTLRLFNAIFSTIPLCDPKDLPASCSKPEMLYTLGEWLADIIDRLFQLLEHVPPMKKGNPFKGHLQGLLRRFFDVLFHQMSPTLYAASLERVVRKALQSLYPPAKQLVGYMLDSAVSASPTEALAKVVPLLCGKIVSPAGEICSSESEATYYLHLLGHAITRAGPALLAYSAQVDAVLGATALHAEQAYFKEGQKLLRKALRAHIGVYPTDYRSLPPLRSGFAGETDFLAACLRPLPLAEMAITFNAPTAQCQARARAQIETWLSKAENAVAENSSGGTGLRSALMCVAAIVRGGAALFPPAPMQWDVTAGSEGDDADLDATPHVTPALKPDDPAWGASLRQRISALLTGATKAYGAGDNPDVPAVKALVAAVSRFLACKGAFAKHDKLKQAVAYDKAVQRHYDLSEEAAHSRQSVVSRTHALLGRRSEQGVYEEDAVAKSLLDYLLSACMHEYCAVRKKAQKLLPDTIRRYPRCPPRLLAVALSRLQDPTATKGAISGVVYTVQNAQALLRVARSWELSQALVVGLLASQHFEDTKVQVRLAELWTSWCPYFVAPPLTGLIRPDALSTDPDIVATLPPVAITTQLEAGNRSLAAREKRSRAALAEMSQGLSRYMDDGLSGGKVHWRVAVLAGAGLSTLVRRDNPMDASTVKLFLRGLNSDILPMRQMCRAVVPALFISAGSSSGDAMEVDGAGGDAEMTDAAGELLSAASFDTPLDCAFSGPFFDPVWVGWAAPPRATESPVNTIRASNGEAAAAAAAAAKEALSSVEWVQGVIDKVGQDHRLSGDERAEGSKAGAAAGMPLASAAVQAAWAVRIAFPRTSAAPLSDSFSLNNMLTFAAIARAAGPEGLEALWAPLEKAIEAKSDRELQCTAAEIVAGLHVGSLSWSAASGDSLQTRLAALLAAALPTVETGSVDFWAMGLRYMVSNRDPRRTSWLSATAASLASSSSEAKSSDVSRGLKMQQALLMEYSWRGLPLARAVANATQGLLGGSSKTVREEAGRGLVLIARALHPRESSTGGAPPDTAAEISAWLLPLLAQLQVEYSAAPLDAGTPGGLELKGKIEGVLYFFIHALRLGHARAVGSVLPAALPLMLTTQDASDREFAHIGLVALQLSASSAQHPAVAAALLAQAEAALAAESWRVRKAAVTLAGELAHAAPLDPEFGARVVRAVDASLGDAQIEVRQQASQVLAGLLRAAPADTLLGMVARAPKGRRRAKAKEGVSDEDRAGALVRRHAKVLAVAAAILSTPTELPEWMADAVTSLCALTDEDPIIRSSITKAVGEFRKSHEDMWEHVRMTWTEEQLRLVSESSGTQSYFS